MNRNHGARYLARWTFIGFVGLAVIASIWRLPDGPWLVAIGLVGGALAGTAAAKLWLLGRRP